ncbi:hypothetical protein PHLCEN_2v118 [Hermanssonia centrifuga]|uniref:Altered inheritance of mitochondria protein 24, mitochondrial n=1 Tax=Hermanssonia centrifuga TaxID=98765 RepID=A0A2R6S710_9APHY|nr:hypothetical protein PHLCEN_2v118 [Hermanssonia centrifuga]
MSYSPSYPPPHGPPPPGFPASPQPGFHVGSTYPGQSPSFNPPPRSGPSPGGGGASAIETTGAYEGAQFRIAHRDSNSLLSVRLQPGYELKAKPGSMVAMDASVKIKGKMSESIFTGPGEVLVAPETWGDIVPISLDGNATWFFGKESFLAATRDVIRTSKSQGLGKAIFSGEGLFVYQATGRGIVFVQSLGAIVQRQLAEGEQWIVDNGHLVAWTASYKVERIDGGGFLSSSHTDEGLVCRFTGPGIVYIQTRNADTLISWIQDKLPSN